MKRILWRTLAGLAWSGFALCAATPQDAVSKSDNVNVRAQPRPSSEIVTRLKKGEPVVILEEVTVKHPAKGDPTVWARIVFPANTPVWVRAEFVDPTNHVVRAKKLNVRAGPGENYSVIGLLVKDETVSEIRVKESWMEIQAPTNTFAFVASELLEKGGVETNSPPATATTNAPPVTAPSPPPEVVATVPETKSAAPVEPEKAAPAKQEPVPAPRVEKTVDAPVPAAPPAVTNTAALSQPAPPVTNAAPVEPPAAPPPVLGKKRIIAREGVVHRAYTLAAPTGFALENTETGLMMDYLYAVNPAIKLKKYLGFRVILTGQEGVDARWPNTPVLMVESVEFP